MNATELSPLFLSLKVASCATLLSLFAGLPLGWILSRRKLPGRPLLEGVLLLPLVLPPTVLGYYLLVISGKTGPVASLFLKCTGRVMPVLAFTWQGAVVAASLVSFPLFVRASQTAFSEIDRDLIEAARIQGANEFQIFRYLTIPLSLRGLISGTGLVFARALGDFGATLMIGGAIPGETRTLPIALYDAVNSGEERTALLYVVILSATCLVFSVVASLLTPRIDR